MLIIVWNEYCMLIIKQVNVPYFGGPDGPKTEGCRTKEDGGQTTEGGEPQNIEYRITNDEMGQRHIELAIVS